MGNSGTTKITFKGAELDKVWAIIQDFSEQDLCHERTEFFRARYYKTEGEFSTPLIELSLDWRNGYVLAHRDEILITDFVKCFAGLNVDFHDYTWSEFFVWHSIGNFSIEVEHEFFYHQTGDPDCSLGKPDRIIDFSDADESNFNE